MADRVVMITGATGALGRVVARSFAETGHRLGLIGTDRQRLTALAAELGLGIAGDRWAAGAGDLADADATAGAVGEITAAFGRIDAWLHLVGGWSGGATVAELDPGELRAMLDQHLWTTLNVARVVVPEMVERGWGRIVGVSVPFVAAPAAKGAAYAVGKAAEETLLRVVAREVAGSGVTSNLIVVRKVDAEHAREAAEPPKGSAAWATPEEIAAVLRFLVSDDAAAINGARIPLDGR